MNPKCQGRAIPDTFSARSAHLTGLKMMPVNRGVSFDHLVSEREQLRWHLKTQCSGGLQIDDQLDFRRLYDWQVGWLFPPENATDVDSKLSISLRQISSVTHETAGHSKFTKWVHRRNGMTCRKCN